MINPETGLLRDQSNMQDLQCGPVRDLTRGALSG